MRYILFLIGLFSAITIHAQQTKKDGFPPVRTTDIAKRTNVIASIPIKTGGAAQSQMVVEAVPLRKVDMAPTDAHSAAANPGMLQNKSSSPGLPSSISVKQALEQLQKQNDSTKADPNAAVPVPEKN